MSFTIVCLYSNYMAVGKIKEVLKMLLQLSRSLFCFLTKMARVLGKNTIVTSSMTPINDVLLHRAFYKGLKNTQVLMGQRWCVLFQMKNNVIFLLCSICSPYNIFFLPCTNWGAMKGLGKRDLAIEFLSHGSNLCRGPASATSEIRWEQSVLCVTEELDVFTSVLCWVVWDITCSVIVRGEAAAEVTGAHLAHLTELCCSSGSLGAVLAQWLHRAEP